MRCRYHLIQVKQAWDNVQKNINELGRTLAFMVIISSKDVEILLATIH